MADENIPNQASNMEPAEGSRETVDANFDKQQGSSQKGGNQAGGNQAGGGITNRPIDEEIENQRDLPPRGEAKKPGEDHA
jgi:hypothetical protein